MEIFLSTRFNLAVCSPSVVSYLICVKAFIATCNYFSLFSYLLYRTITKMERLLFCEYLQKADVCREHKKLFAALVEWCW